MAFNYNNLSPTQDVNFVPTGHNSVLVKNQATAPANSHVNQNFLGTSVEKPSNTARINFLGGNVVATYPPTSSNVDSAVTQPSLRVVSIPQRLAKRVSFLNRLFVAK